MLPQCKLNLLSVSFASPKLEAKMNFGNHYLKSNHSIGIAFWHLQFCTKYRFKMFSKFEYKHLCEACIRKACFQHNIKIVVINVMPDHLHIVVQVSASMCIDDVIRKLKGLSAYLFFRKHPKSRLRYPKGHLWSRGKFRATVGFTELSKTIDYVLHQESKHV
jgi:putative transposase